LFIKENYFIEKPLGAAIRGMIGRVSTYLPWRGRGGASFVPYLPDTADIGEALHLYSTCPVLLVQGIGAQLILVI